MKLIVDFHVHSHFARATSKDLTLENLYQWGKLKGLDVIGTGDFTHPVWFEELRTKLVADEVTATEGSGVLYKLKEELAKEMDKSLPMKCREREIRFALSVEISNIYKRYGKVRRLHNQIVAPSLEVAAKINAKLQEVGNLKSDGRPILGLDSEELLKVMLEASEDCLFVPAHIWTPHFAMFGSKSGFDSVEEAFGDYAKYIYAVETGLSADPMMCRMVSDLDSRTLLSGSDAHSAKNIGREANLFDCELSYSDIIEAIKVGDERYVGTIEFYPQEGMYHADGHRSCDFSCEPEETKKLEGRCPKCGRPLTVGVLSRVIDLADRSKEEAEKLIQEEVKGDAQGQGRMRGKEVKYLIPLLWTMAELLEVKSITSRSVQQMYNLVTQKLGGDFEILLWMPIEEIQEAGFKKLALAIEKMRKGEVEIKPGYDGVYGVIKIGDLEKESKEREEQLGLF